MNWLKGFLFIISGFFPRSKNIFIFGAWFGTRYSDNPRYLLNQMLLSKDFKDKRLIWIGNENIQSELSNLNITFAKRNSLKAYWYELRASKAFVSHGYQDLGSVSFLKGVEVFQLWHGFPIKHIGADDPKNPDEGKHIFETYQFFLADSLVMKRRIGTAFKNYGANKENILLASQPRVDYLVKNNTEKRKQYVRARMKIPTDTFVISYFPTFRDNNEQIFSFSDKASSEFGRFLTTNNAVLLERQHFARNSENKKIMSERYINLDDSIEVQDVLLITDCLITDYSSIYMDFSVLKRPVIHYLYDGQSFFYKDRGLYSDKINDDFAGPMVFNLNQLMESLKEDYDSFEPIRENMANKIQPVTDNRLIDWLRNRS